MASGRCCRLSYGYYNVPYQYRSLYYDTDDYKYRYAPGAIYQVDPDSSLITAVAALLTPGFGVGQPLPMGYSAYNVPLRPTGRPITTRRTPGTVTTTATSTRSTRRPSWYRDRRLDPDLGSGRPRLNWNGPACVAGPFRYPKQRRIKGMTETCARDCYGRGRCSTVSACNNTDDQRGNERRRADAGSRQGRPATRPSPPGSTSKQPRSSPPPRPPASTRRWPDPGPIPCWSPTTRRSTSSRRHVRMGQARESRPQLTGVLTNQILPGTMLAEDIGKAIDDGQGQGGAGDHGRRNADRDQRGRQDRADRRRRRQGDRHQGRRASSPTASSTASTRC